MWHKYHAKQTIVDGIRFHSKKEADYYCGLCYARKAGELLYALRQVPFDLPGGVIYRCDFLEFWKDGKIRFVDTKGFQTQESKNKIKMVEALYPIKIMLT